MEVKIVDSFEIEVDADLFIGALVNLIDNAFKASPLNAKVSIGSNIVDDQKLSLLKTKAKVFPLRTGKILEPFYRLEYSRSRREGGLGLGLTPLRKLLLVMEPN